MEFGESCAKALANMAEQTYLPIALIVPVAENL